MKSPHFFKQEGAFVEIQDFTGDIINAEENALVSLYPGFLRVLKTRIDLTIYAVKDLQRRFSRV